MFVLATIPQLLLALMIANLLNRPLRARTAFRMGILAPNITSLVAVGVVFGFIFAERYGLARCLLGTSSGSASSPGATPSCQPGPRSPPWSTGAGPATTPLSTSAAMQAIPKRAVRVGRDRRRLGAWRQFWTITVPLIRPTILFTVIMSTIGGMQLFTEPLLFNYGRIRGGSPREFQTVAMYIYERPSPATSSWATAPRSRGCCSSSSSSSR